ncbi:MAG: outer membrane protein assembly factor BamA [Sphaerochaetaceae bacterium]
MRKFLLILIVFATLFSLVAAENRALEQWWVGKPIEEFIYIDLQSVDSKEIDKVVDDLIGKPFNNNQINEARNKLLNRGEFIEIEMIPSRYQGSTDKVVVYIEFVEQKLLGKVAFSGNKVLSSDQLTSIIDLKVGQKFDLTGVEKQIATIKESYKARGYDRVDIIYSYETDPNTDQITLTYKLTEYEWYLNKTIRGFIFEGLKNVSKDSLDDLTYPFIGRAFTQENYQNIERELNNLKKFSLFEAEAKRGGPNNTDLYLLFRFTELPVIKSIEFVGNSGVRTKVLEDNLNVKVGEFLSLASVRSTKDDLEELYRTRGYADVEVTSDYTIDENSNLLDLVYTVVENQQTKIGEIVFEGNVTLSSSTLKKELSSKVQSLFNAGNYDKAKVDSDMQALLVAYQKRGYIDVNIKDVIVDELESENPDIKKVKLTFIVEENDQWFYGGIVVEGNTIFSDEQIFKNLSMREGSVLNITKVQDEIGKIADIYWNDGYVENSIDIDEIRDNENKLVTYKVIIGERAQAVVEQVIIRGLTKTKPYVLERELALKAGDIFSKDKYVSSAQNLYNTGLLTDVEPSISYGTQENALVVTYDVVEGNQMNIGFGATFGGNVEGFPVSGFLSWADTNVAGTGRDLEVMTELSPSSQSASITFRDNWVKDKRWSNAIDLSFNRTTYKNGLQLGDHSPTTELRNNKAYPYPFTSYEAWEKAKSATPDEAYLMPYDYYRVSLGYSTGYTFMFKPGRLSVGIGPTFTLNRAIFNTDVFTPFDWSTGKYGEKWQFSNRIGLSLSWDGRDLIHNTTKGYMVSQSLTYAGGLLGGLSNYMRSSTSASGFLKLFEIPGEKPTPGVLSLNTTVSFMFEQFFKNESGSWITGMNASKYEYLYIDGITLARGISPKFYFEFLWDSSLEFSIQLAENVIWAEAFVSATGASFNLKEVGTTPLNWYFSTGFGIRLKIPGFPLGLYLVKNAHIEDGGAFSWEGGPIFKGKGGETAGMKLVLAITQFIY